MIVLRLAALCTLFLATRLVALPRLASAAERPSDPAAAAGRRAGSPAPEGLDNKAAFREETCGYLDRNTTVKPEVWDGRCPYFCLTYGFVQLFPAVPARFFASPDAPAFDGAHPLGSSALHSTPGIRDRVSHPLGVSLE